MRVGYALSVTATLLVTGALLCALGACSKRDSSAAPPAADADAASPGSVVSLPSARAQKRTPPFDEDGDDSVTLAAKLNDDAERYRKGAAALASVKMDARADLAVAPKDGLYANFFGHLTTLDAISMSWWGGDRWGIDALMGGDVQLGLIVWFTEEEIGAKKFGRALGQGDSQVQMPRDPEKWPLKDNDEGIGRRVPSAYNVEMTRFQPGEGRVAGKCARADSASSTTTERSRCG
jgi:hypothetical protein